MEARAAHGAVLPELVRRRRFQVLVFLVGAVLPLANVQAQSGKANSFPHVVTELWPTTVTNYNLLRDGAIDQAFLERLANVTLAGYRKYVDKVLPKEEALDAALLQSRTDLDEASYRNRAFLRWQKGIFTKMNRQTYQDLNWEGNAVPTLQGVPYKWDKFYKSSEYRTLQNTFRKLANEFVNSPRGGGDKIPFQVFIWAEVYPPGAYQKVHTHTGSPCAGMFMLKAPGSLATEGEKRRPAQYLSFEDARGVALPFGRVHRHRPEDGQVLLWPSWAPHSLSPNRGTDPTIYLGFIAFHPEGATEFDWEDDPHGDFEHTSMESVRWASKKGGKDQGASSREEL
eukprot:TRINITY_DN23232_c0_g2_i1.p2 TRINITY_DN23232_c0_g2~~TRINITY_DN23232_c0_g2_i1.p2  ORF type:complete len:341 (+),score=49.94 TRINITY_DN23232_c0_g2_i1:55-1077(+)